MKRLRTSELSDGMIVAEDIYGRSGEVVMPVGAQLTEKSIGLLEGWGVSSVAVEGEEDDLTKKFNAEQVAEIEKEVTEKFVANAKENPFIVQLIKYCVQRKLKQKLSGVATPAVPAPAATPASAPAQAAPAAPTEAPKTS